MNFSKHIICIISIPFLILLGSWTSVEKVEAISWITWEEAVELTSNEAHPKKVFVDVYTDWCGWCKVMDKKTFNHSEVAKYMSENFYMVKLDAEQKEDIIYKGSTFKFIPQGKRGYHQLAATLLQGKLSFPTTVFLDEKMSIMTILPGFQKPGFFYKVANYFGEDNHKKQKWEEFEKSYEIPFVVESE